MSTLLPHARLFQAWAPPSAQVSSDSPCQAALFYACSPPPVWPSTSHFGLPHLLPILRHGGLPCSDGFSAKLYGRDRKEREVKEGEEDVCVFVSSHHTGFQNEQCYSAFHPWGNCDSEQWNHLPTISWPVHKEAASEPWSQPLEPNSVHSILSLKTLVFKICLVLGCLGGSVS